MHLARSAPALLLCLIAGACERDRPSNPPEVIEQTASDVETEVDGAGQTVEQVADDVDHTATDVVDGDD